MTPKKARAAKVEPQASGREWVEPFLASLSKSGNVRSACLAAKVSRKVAYAYRAGDAEFAERWAEALEEAIELLEGAAFERARQSSDTLMIFLLKAHKPAVYREATKVEHEGNVSVTVTYADRPIDSGAE